jgi:hypothetical protein
MSKYRGEECGKRPAGLLSENKIRAGSASGTDELNNGAAFTGVDPRP